MSRNDDVSLILTKAKKQGWLPDVPSYELDVLELETRNALKDDVHPSADDIVTGESTLPRPNVMQSSITLTSQHLILNFFTAKKTEVVNTVRYTIGSVLAGATPTLCRIGLYFQNDDLSLTLVASTVNDTAMFGAGTFGAFTKPLSASYTKVRGERYAIGILINSTFTMPTVYGNASHVASVAFAEPKLCARHSVNQTDLPASITNANLTATNLQLYAEVY